MRTTTSPESEQKVTAGAPMSEEAPAGSGNANRGASVLLWIIQGLLALLFVFAGGMKLVLPLAELTKQTPLPGLFLRFIGLAELAGGLGLILPGLFRIRPGLTPLAAGGLVIIMIGGTAMTLAAGPIALSLIPAAVGLLAAFVAYGRWRLVPHRGPSRRASRRSGLQPAG
jgi:hypothetical protein